MPRIIRTINEMYNVLKEGCAHYNQVGSVQICLACRLEIFSELKRLHEMEDEIYSELEGNKENRPSTAA